MEFSNPEKCGEEIKEFLCIQIHIFIAKEKKLDVLVLNAGVSQRDSFEQMNLETAQKIMKINFISCLPIIHVIFKYSQESLPYLKQSKGSISIISSLKGLIGSPDRTIYAASKHALQGFGNSLRAEVKTLKIQINKYDISVTIACPDYTRTNISINALKGDGSEYGKMDKEIEKGMSPIDCAYIIAKTTFDRDIEVWISSFYNRFMIYILRMFPSLHAKYLFGKVTKQKHHD